MFNMISMIACMAKNRVIGQNGNIPWHIKEDFQHFKRYTLNKAVLMGRTTFKSLNEKPLVNRTNYVLTSNIDLYKDRNDIIVINNLLDTLNEYMNTNNELVIIGGEKVYKQCLPYCDEIILSVINKDYDGDTYFPEFENDFYLYDVVKYSEFSVLYYRRS